MRKLPTGANGHREQRIRALSSCDREHMWKKRNPG